MLVELNRISLGITSLAGNTNLTVVTVINQSLSGVLKLSHLQAQTSGKPALPLGKLREDRPCLSSDSLRS